MSIGHGSILGGLSTVPNLDQAIIAYRDVLGLDLVEQGEIPPALGESWNCAANIGSRYAVLRPKSGEPCWMRLVEQADHPDFTPTTTYGWAAFELTVEDVWRWPEALPAEHFTLAGLPKKLENVAPAFIPMQVLGPGKELIYLNQVLDNMPGTDLPRAQSPVDRIFITVLATPDRPASLRWYTENVGFARGSDYSFPYSMINKAFDLPADRVTTITMIQQGRMPIVEVDDYPDSATKRVGYANMLPPGNALVTLAVRDLDACQVDWITSPMRHDGTVYEGRRAATTIGPAGELLELVEVGE